MDSGCATFTMPNPHITKKIRADARDHYNLRKQVTAKCLMEYVLDLQSFASLYEVETSEVEGQNETLVTLRLPVRLHYAGLHLSSITDISSTRRQG
jgi:hypothetical protein